MNEQEIKQIETSIDALAEIIVELTHQKTELELRIDELENEKARLTRLLPNDKRIERLFQ